MDELLNDKRFAYIARDPKFKRIPKTERKVKIDKRFQSMFKDKKFSVQYTIDKRGRPISQTSSENLRKYYDLPSSEEDDNDEEEEEQEEEKQKHKIKNKKSKKEKKKEKKEHKIVKLKESKSVKYNLNDQNEDEHSSDNCFSSNGELLRIKPKEECDIESNEESESGSDENEQDSDTTNEAKLVADLKESKKQLQIRNKNETTEVTDKIKKKLKDLSVNYARGEGVLLSDSSSSEEESSDVSDDEEIEHAWGELDKEAETTNEITHRLAVCNMDWDRIRAVDLMVLLTSFLPSGSFIRSVAVYPSEFGLQRMKEEEITGPKELTEVHKDRDIDDENDDEEGSAYHMERLRQYQLNRLKYYYAVVDFDSAETANKIYTECDGTEYESTATKLDLRFIPDDMEFDQTPREICNEVPELSKYQPRQFTTTALQQVKVELTWDETNPERLEIAEKLKSGNLTDIKDTDLQAYLATDSSGDEEETKEEKVDTQQNTDDSGTETNADPIEKYKSLLKDIEEKEEAKQKKEVELEFTWGLGTKEKAEKLVQERMKKDENLTPFEQYLEKRKAKKKAKREERKKLKNQDKDASMNSEGSGVSDLDEDKKGNKKKTTNKSRKNRNDIKKDGLVSSDDEENEERRKAELELLLLDENEGDGKQHFNMKKIEENATMSKSKQKRLSKKKDGQNQMQEDDFEVNVEDPRFNALFTSHHFNIDPADPHYRRTKGTETLIKEKLKRRAEDEPAAEVQTKQPKHNMELQSLIKSVKKNAKNLSRPIK